MDRRSAWGVLVVVLTGCGAASEVTETPREGGDSVEASSLPCLEDAPEGSPADRLAWMIGVWESEEDGAVTTERWCPGEGGVLIGDSRTRAGERVVHSEQLRVEAREGALVYVASPSRQATTEFRGDARCGTDALSGNCSRSCEAVFENPEHDFPTEITYGRCVQNEFLVATIRGGDRRASWTFRRVER